MWSLAEPALFTRLSSASSVLIVGAGGGFDAYVGLSLAFALQGLGKRVHLANLSFSELATLDLDDWVAPDVASVGPDSAGNDDYFPACTWPGGCTGKICLQRCTRSRVPVSAPWRVPTGRWSTT